MQRTTARRWLGAGLTTLALGGLAAAPAGAISLDNTTDTSFTIDSSVHWFNDVEPLTDGDYSRSGNYQIMVYWDASSPGIWDPAALKVTRRTLATDRLESVDFAGTYELTDVVDGRNTLHSAISPIDGRIHISWTGPSTGAHQYVISSAHCVSEARFSDCTWSRRSQQADASERGRVFNPMYFTSRYGGLHMTYREGSSTRGNQYLNSYNNDGTWTHHGMIIQGVAGGTYDPDGGGSIPASRDRGPFVCGMKFDKAGRLHMMWSWREAGAYSGTGAQHGVYYASSDDYGATWNASGGFRIAEAGSDPLNVNDGAQVVNLPYGSHLQAYELEVDSHGQPHAVIAVSDVVSEDSLGTNIRQAHVWRTPGSGWHSSWIEPSGGRSQVYEFGDLMFDRADNAYYIYNDNQTGWAPWNVDAFAQAELRNDMMTVQSSALNIQQQSTTTAIVTDSYVGTPISTSGNKQIRVRMRNETEARSAYFAWTTDASQGWSGNRLQTFAISARDTGYQTYTFTITDADWTGTLRSLEFDPIDGTRADSGDEIDIDYIRITDAAGTIAKQWEFNSGGTVVAAESPARGNWPSWIIDTLLPGVNDTWSDAGFNIDAQRYADGSGDDKKVNFAVLGQGNPGIETLTLRQFDILGDDLSKDWNFDVDTQGWTAENTGSFGWHSGESAMVGTLTSTGATLYSPDHLGMVIDGDIIHVRMRNTSAGTRAQVGFRTLGGQWAYKSFNITANSGYTNYSVDMSSVAGWTAGEALEDVLIVPSSATTGSFGIDRIYIAP